MRCAVLYQAGPPPLRDGAAKPMKQGGYADSGADIVYALRSAGVAALTPDGGWVFPDTAEGIEDALARGADLLWANTVLYAGHPIENVPAGIRIVGQTTAIAERFDNKWNVSSLLRANGIPVPRAALLGEHLVEVPFPLILKPVRGRGSQGVVRVADAEELRRRARELTQVYGPRVLAEEYLSGEEITVTVMPSGPDSKKYWAMPVVRRFDHEDGVLPYSGVVAVVRNSCVVEVPTAEMLKAVEHCCKAAELIGARAPIRVDCRQGDSGEYRLFDVNLKPNLTGPGRPGRDDQDSLVSIAARALGWTYPELVKRMAEGAWTTA